MSSVYVLEGEVTKFQHLLAVQGEGMAHASMINDEMKASWNQLATTNAPLRGQLRGAEMVHSSEQRDSPTRIDDDMLIRSELAACLAREGAWKSELRTTSGSTHVRH